jgi:peptide/nickel transport system ATP-binding protein
MAEPLVSVRNLRVNFRVDRHTSFEAVKGISFDIPVNSTVALVGESGSGKSVTSLSILACCQRRTRASLPGSQAIYGGRNLIELSQRELRDLRGKEISMIFQEPMSSLNPVFSVGFQLAETLRLHMALSPGDAHRRGIELLREVGIPEPEKSIEKYPHQMSGGQQQRVMIAMAIACEPSSSSPTSRRQRSTSRSRSRSST